MSFTCLKCAKCMAEVIGGIDWAIELKKPSTPIIRGKCDGHCNHEVIITKIDEKAKTITVERVENSECGEIKS